MRTLCDYTLKFLLRFFIFARFISDPAPEPHNAAPVQEPSTGHSGLTAD
jgi:hypothetical protein